MSTGDLTAVLSAAGALPKSWAAAFAEVDRAGFIPARVWFDDEHGRTQPLDRDGEPDRWRSAVYSDEPIVTQLDDGATVWPASSNAPTVVCADGAGGWPGTAPYDRIICTAAVVAGRLPYAWVEHGAPGRTRYGLTITPTEQHLWLDEPANTITAAA